MTGFSLRSADVRSVSLIGERDWLTTVSTRRGTVNSAGSNPVTEHKLNKRTDISLVSYVAQVKLI